MVASRPSEEMFQALKRHILHERQKKKQEQEADAEVERQRRERELKQKQDDMTLGENLEQITLLEQLLSRLKEEKHQLFLQLKKVLNDDRRRQLVHQQESCDVTDFYSGFYSHAPQMGVQQMGVSQPMSLINYEVPDRSMYKYATDQRLLHPGSVKRARSPSSPPLQPAYSSYGHKSPAPRVNYSSGQNYPYGNSQFGQGSTAEGASTPPKHPLYLSSPLPPRPQITSAYLSVDLNKGRFPDDKFYSAPPVRLPSHVPMHGCGIPIQQPSQGVKTGGITSGYPIRAPSSSAPPPAPTHRGAPNNPSPHNTHNVYVSQSSSVPVSRLSTHNPQQPPTNSGRYIQREA